MKIISGGKKDYYDFLSGIYGIDEDIVYDRRNSIVLKDFGYCKNFFSKIKDFHDLKKRKYKRYHYEGNKLVYGVIEEGVISYFVIEIGYYQYLFRTERYLDDNSEVQIDVQLCHKIELKEKKSKAPISIIPVEYFGFFRETPEIKEYLIKQEAQNPILCDTWVTSYIPPEEIYNNVYNYLISIREPNIVDKRTDIEKLESKGFDKKISFRNIK